MTKKEYQQFKAKYELMGQLERKDGRLNIQTVNHLEGY